jgi:signal transduction histidine kinase
MHKKTTGFRFEVRLGLALIILVLVGLNFASYYALYRTSQSIEIQAKEELTEAGLMVSNALRGNISSIHQDSTIADLKKQYGLQKVTIIPFPYRRAIEIQNGQPPDSGIIALDSTLKLCDLMPLLQSQLIYRHRKGEPEHMVIMGAELAGTKCILTVSKENSLLSSLESAGSVLLFFGILGAMIIIYAAAKFIKYITSPFNRLKKRAEETGKLELGAPDEISQLISTYENIIEELHRDEKELTRLNEASTRRAEDLEIFNNYILKSVNAGIITLDNDCRITSINRAAQSILLIDNDVIGKIADDSFGRYPCILDLIEKSNRSGEIDTGMSIRLKIENANSVDLSISLSSLQDSRGNKIGLSIILNDQTDFMRIQEELEISRRMASLGEMSGGLAHQLRNSSAAMVGLAKLIDRKIDPANPVRENVRLLMQEAMEASELVGRFLDFARPLQLDKEIFKVGDFLQNIVENVRSRYPNIEIEIAKAGLLNFTIEGDSLLLKQSIGNIVDNACKAVLTEMGKVTITLQKSDRFLVIDISDNGGGIPLDMKDKIFTPFFSGSASGSGLGLPLAAKIMALHGGRIEFKSRLPRGTTFAISIPLSANQFETASKSEIAVPTR